MKCWVFPCVIYVRVGTTPRRNHVYKDKGKSYLSLTQTSHFKNNIRFSLGIYEATLQKNKYITRAIAGYVKKILQ